MTTHYVTIRRAGVDYKVEVDGKTYATFASKDGAVRFASYMTRRV